MAVAAPADKRFRRSHINPARRRRLRYSWPALARIGAVCTIALYAVYRAASLVVSAEALIVSRITVSGNTRMSRGEVLSLLEGVRGSSMMTADLEGWRRKLRDSPWVADAAIRRVLPGTLAVAISEREAIGIARVGASLYLVDQRGAIIDEFGPNYAEFDLPIIDGLAALPQSGGALIDEARAALAARLLGELERRPAIARQVSQIDVADLRGAAVILKGDTALVRIGDDRFLDRIQSYIDLRPTLRERVPDIDYVDLRFDERVYVRPQASGVRNQTGLRAQASGRRRSGQQ